MTACFARIYPNRAALDKTLLKALEATSHEDQG